jgi:hypothetical protein
MSQGKEARCKRPHLHEDSDEESSITDDGSTTEPLSDDQPEIDFILTDIIECEYDHIAGVWCVQNFVTVPGFIGDASKFESIFFETKHPKRTKYVAFLDDAKHIPKPEQPAHTYTWVCTRKYAYSTAYYQIRSYGVTSRDLAAYHPVELTQLSERVTPESAAAYFAAYNANRAKERPVGDTDIFVAHHTIPWLTGPPETCLVPASV